MKRFLYILLVPVITFILVEGVLRIVYWEDWGDLQAVIKVLPHSPYEIDSVLGWSMRTGEYSFWVDEQPFPGFSIDQNNNRKINLVTKTNDKLYLLGCSFTFGSSLEDTCTYPYYLQELLKNQFEVVNKGVAGYGLLQMYLSLERDLANAIVPAGVIVNYAPFQNNRSILDKNWERNISSSLSQRFDESGNFNMPYARLNDDNGLHILYKNESDLIKSGFFKRNFMAVDMLTEFYDVYSSKEIRNASEDINLLICEKIITLCKEENIKLLFYGLEDHAMNLFEQLDTSQMNMVITSIDLSQMEYNNSPIDPLHPNKVATKIMARDIYEYVSDNQW